MTLVLSAAGHVLQGQFGVNEIASAITVGNIVGSIFTRATDAKIYPALESGYSIFVERVPRHLETISFDRPGTVLGENHRKLRLDNTFGGVEFGTLEGVATFLILVLRYVETRADILAYIKQMLHGDFGLVNGGKLARTSPEKHQLPYSLKPLKSHINAVLDADAASRQHGLCMNWMAELYSIVGGGGNARKASEFAHRNYKAFLKSLLSGHLNKAGERETNAFHTLSLGTALISLAALANGANVRLTVVTAEKRVNVPEHAPHFTAALPFEVFLWLTEPPLEISAFIKFDSALRLKKAKESPALPIYGGDAELSTIIAAQLNLSCPADEIIELWRTAIQEGSRVTWQPESKSSDARAFYIRAILTSSEDSLLEPLAKIFYSGPRSDRTHLLAYKAAAIYHAVYKRRDYKRVAETQEQEVQNVLTFIAGAFAIGCLKSLISTPVEELTVYAWTLYIVEGALDLDQWRVLPDSLVRSGLTTVELLNIVGKIWGGLNSRTRFDPYASGVAIMRAGCLPALGIVCPHKTVVLDVLHDPLKIAKFGLSRGIFSLYSGSTPLLPQDPSGIIWGSDLDIPTKVPDNSDLESLDLDEGQFLFTAEPSIPSDGKICVVLCAWKFGDAIFQLNPADVFANLVRCRALKEAKAAPTNGYLPPKQGVRNLTRGNVYSGSFKQELEEDTIAIVESDGRLDFGVICAGHYEAGTMVVVGDEKEIQLLRKGEIPAVDLGDFNAVVIV